MLIKSRSSSKLVKILNDADVTNDDANLKLYSLPFSTRKSIDDEQEVVIH
jgi:hypothetical protein